MSAVILKSFLLSTLLSHLTQLRNDTFDISNHRIYTDIIVVSYLSWFYVRCFFFSGCSQAPSFCCAWQLYHLSNLRYLQRTVSFQLDSGCTPLHLSTRYPLELHIGGFQSLLHLGSVDLHPVVKILDPPGIPSCLALAILLFERFQILRSHLSRCLLYGRHLLRITAILGR